MPEREYANTILIVDDSAVNRMLLCKIFANEYNTLQASNGVEALRILREYPNIDAMLLDIMMPKMDGYAVLEAMQKNPSFKDISVVVDTSADDTETQIKVLDLGAVDVLVKPFNPMVVQHRIRNIIMRREAGKQALQNALLTEQIHLLETDEKTGIYTRRAFVKRTGEMIRKDTEHTYVLIRWDIDRFKVLNDAFGMHAGAQYLKEVGVELKQKMAKGTTYGHLEADRFIVCMQQNKEKETAFIKAIETAVVRFLPSFKCVVRFGLYVINDPNVDVSLMCDRAQMALRSTKNNYSKNVACYDDSMRTKMIEQQEIASEMEAALADGQFVPYFQPQYIYDKNQLHGAEALVRWIHPVKGVVSPAAFIPVFESNGFITVLDEYIWEQACRYQRKWLDEGIAIRPVSVNISRRDIYEPKLVSILTGLLKKYDLPVEYLRLEITESAYMDDSDQIISVVKQLRECGFAIEMDDFGSGYSSLNTLWKLPVDLLKLDMNFLSDGVHDDSRGVNILSSVVRMANWMHLPVLAEGVETKEQADYLKSINCLFMQGYYFAKPMPAKAYEKILMDSSEHDLIHSMELGKHDDSLSITAESALLKNAEKGAAIIEFDGKNIEILRMNDRFFEELGTTREEYMGKQLHVLDRLEEESRPLYLGAINRAIKSCKEETSEIRSLPFHENGKCFTTMNRFRLLAKSGNRFIIYVGVERV